MAEKSLEEMAQAHERGRQQLAEVEATIERLKGPYDEAIDRRHELKKALELIEQGMETAKRAHLIQRAVEEADAVDWEAPPVVTVTQYSSIERWELVAIGPEWSALYRYQRRARGRFSDRQRTIGTSYARLRRAGEEEWEPPELTAEERREMHTQQRVRELQIRAEARVRFVHGTDLLFEWEMRGRGQFGEGSGSIKPKPPPEGGRWRWLKVREQESLERGGADDGE